MAKYIRTQNSDGSWSESVEQKKGCMYYLGLFFAVTFVIVIAIHYWWVAVVIVLIAIVGAVGGIQKMKESK